jgi:hypothetical protein
MKSRDNRRKRRRGQGYKTGDQTPNDHTRNDGSFYISIIPLQFAFENNQELSSIKLSRIIKLSFAFQYASAFVKLLQN